MTDQNKKNILKRIGIYGIGILLVSLGIVLCKKCGMGVSPISSIPFVLMYITPLSFGALTTIFHFVNIFAQMILSRGWKNPKLWMQIPLAFVFGWIIDLLNRVIQFNNEIIGMQIVALVLSIFFTALGMVCMLDMNLIQNPPDGTVYQISVLTHKKLGNVKVIYDISCVLISVLLGIVFCRKIVGFGIATISSAFFVGRTINWIRVVLQKK